MSEHTPGPSEAGAVCHADRPLPIQIARGPAIVRELGGRTGTLVEPVNYLGEVCFLIDMDEELPEWARGWDAEHPKRLLVDVDQIEPKKGEDGELRAEKAAPAMELPPIIVHLESPISPSVVQYVTDIPDGMAVEIRDYEVEGAEKDDIKTDDAGNSYVVTIFNGPT